MTPCSMLLQSNKVREARQRGPEGDGRVFKTSNKVQGKNLVPAATNIQQLVRHSWSEGQTLYSQIRWPAGGNLHAQR